MSLWSAYKNLTPRTKLLFGIGLIAWSGLGLYLQPSMEKRMGMVPSKEEQEELERKLRLQIHTVERENNK